jgi:hypothetical protein
MWAICLGLGVELWLGFGGRAMIWGSGLSAPCKGSARRTWVQLGIKGPSPAQHAARGADGRGLLELRCTEGAPYCLWRLSAL